jgi:hypothetical protein
MKSLCIAGLLAGFGMLASAAEVEGVLMDKACSTKAVSGGQSAAKAHDRECALTTNCQKSGYGVFTADNKFVTLDAAGNEKAVAALKASKKKDDLRVRVTGDVQGDTVKVKDLKLL